ncbi:hypothetical protein ACFQU7_14590 [Pseudoroseomonas wenyumeiae]
MAQASVGGILLPKAESPAALARLHQAAPRAALVPLVETARGLAEAAALAAAPGVVRLAFGSVDFQLDLGIPEEGRRWPPSAPSSFSPPASAARLPQWMASPPRWTMPSYWRATRPAPAPSASAASSASIRSRWRR